MFMVHVKLNTEYHKILIRNLCHGVITYNVNQNWDYTIILFLNVWRVMLQFARRYCVFMMIFKLEPRDLESFIAHLDFFEYSIFPPQYTLVCLERMSPGMFGPEFVFLVTIHYLFTLCCNLAYSQSKALSHKQHIIVRLVMCNFCLHTCSVRR